MFKQIPYQPIPQQFIPGFDGRELNYTNTKNQVTYGQPYPHQFIDNQGNTMDYNHISYLVNQYNSMNA